MNKQSRKVSCPSDEEMRYFIHLMIDQGQHSLLDRQRLDQFKRHLSECNICQTATSGLLKWHSNEGNLPPESPLPDHLRALLK